MGMNLDHLEDNWKQFTHGIKQRWRTLVDDHLDLFMGKRVSAKPAADKPLQEIERPK